MSEVPPTGSPTLMRLGYWRPAMSERALLMAERYPDPSDFVDEGWDDDDRDLIADYLERGFVARAFMGMSPCRMCGRSNGALEMTDGIYIWPNGLSHYVRDHQVRPPDRFVDHVLEETRRLETAAVDDNWWVSLQSRPDVAG